MTSPQALLVNARFRGQQATTGVHRWATEVLAALPAHGVRPVELRPERGSRARGHAWEQLVLPWEMRRHYSELPLFSPCNWGPVAMRRQALVLHDVSPLVVPEHFSRGYATLTRLQLPVLARRVRTLLTVSQASKADIVDRLGVDEERVVVVGAGTRALPTPDPAVVAILPAPYFAFVGAHDSRKNLRFLLNLWPRVHAATGAHLVVTRRPDVTTNLTSACPVASWFTELISPTDAELSAVLQGARALLWPSTYEGFGLPLLEAYLCGTGFVSTDTGVAAELVLPGDAVLPLESEAWVEAITARVEHDPGDPAARRTRAAVHSWEKVAERVATALARG